MKKTQKNAETKEKKSKILSYRIKGIRTSNGLSHFVPKEKRTLV